MGNLGSFGSSIGESGLPNGTNIPFSQNEETMEQIVVNYMKTGVQRGNHTGKNTWGTPIEPDHRQHLGSCAIEGGRPPKGGECPGCTDALDCNGTANCNHRL
jgi:hypothetical protein